MLIYNFYGLLLSSHVQKKVLAFCFYTLLSWNGNNMLLSIVVRAKWMLLLLCVGWCPLGEENAAGIGRPTHLLSFFLPDAYTYSHKKWEPTQNCYFVLITCWSRRGEILSPKRNRLTILTLSLKNYFHVLPFYKLPYAYLSLNILSSKCSVWMENQKTN